MILLRNILRFALVAILTPFAALDMVLQTYMAKFTKYRKAEKDIFIDIVYWMVYIPFAIFSIPVNWFIVPVLEDITS
ncbi:MAG: hypothetical protein K9M36_02550 [Candidatus Pacebacteria bacterium]|nr:hypothetical protein [Candidatus Paceibacterota bacterium]